MVQLNYLYQCSITLQEKLEYVFLFCFPVRDRCTYRSALGVIFEVRSGETFIDLSACRRCLCRDGDSVLCEALRDSDCGVINPTPGPDRDCTIRGRTLPSGESVAVSSMPCTEHFCCICCQHACT